MARKEAHKKKAETTLVPHRTPDLNSLLDRARTGDSALAVKAYLDAGGVVGALVLGGGPSGMQQIPLLHHMALYSSHPHAELAECVRLLVAAGADINCLSGDARTAVMCASERRCCTRALQIFLQSGADVLVSTPSAITTLHHAAMAGRTDSCELLLAKESSLIHLKDVEGCTALLYAVESGHVDTAKMLCQHGADVNTLTTRKTTALMAACTFFKSAGMVASLIVAGADVNAADQDGNTALMLAAQETSAEAMQLLLSSGADIHAANDSGQNALFAAAQAGQVCMMELLVQHGLSITAFDNKGITLLMTAAVNGHKPAAEWLLQRGVPVDAVDSLGCSALHHACLGSCDHAAMVELLLASAADVHKRSEYHQTPLFVAASRGHVQCAKALLAAGAGVNTTDISGVIPLHIALHRSHSAVAQLLLEHGATAVMNSVVPVHCCNRPHCCTGLTALMMCTTADTVKVLLAAGADVHVTTDGGDTCLHKAAVHGYAAPVVCLLIKAGANLHAVNSKGKTAAEVAHDNGFTLIEQLLNRAAQQGH
jgi:uncharacterized protein